MRISDRIRPHVLPLVAGVGAGVFLFFGAAQDQFSPASSLAPVAATAAFFTPVGAGWLVLPIALNGLTYVAIATAIRSTWRTRRWLSIVLAGIIVWWVASAFEHHAAIHRLRSYSEVVLKPGMKLTARTPNGMLTILAGNGTRRTYLGDGWKKSFLLVPRRQRWYGSLGLYDPAESFSPDGRVLVDEGRQHFSTQREAEGWLEGRRREASVGKDRLTYTNDGLVLRYIMDTVPGSSKLETANIFLWQVYVDGRRPHGLPGADDSAIRIEGGAVADSSTPH